MDIGDIVNPELLTEALREARKAKREDLELAEAMQALLVSQGWQLYLERVLGPRIQSFGELLLQPAGSQDGAWRTEFVKGALYAFCLARDLPSVIVSATPKDVRAEHTEELRDA